MIRLLVQFVARHTGYARRRKEQDVLSVAHNLPAARQRLTVIGLVLAGGLIATPVTGYAQSGGGQGDIFSFLLPIVLITGVFWFFLIRPQQKREKERKAMLASIQRGDRIITNGGIHARVRKVIDNETLEIEINKETVVTSQRQMIFSVIKDKNTSPQTEDAVIPKKKAPRKRTTKSAS